MPTIAHSDADIERLCAVGLTLGVYALRSCHWALRVARVAAALRGAARVEDEDLSVAARLVLALLLPPLAMAGQGDAVGGVKGGVEQEEKGRRISAQEAGVLNSQAG